MPSTLLETLPLSSEGLTLDKLPRLTDIGFHDHGVIIGSGSAVCDPVKFESILEVGKLEQAGTGAQDQTSIFTINTNRGRSCATSTISKGQGDVNIVTSDHYFRVLFVLDGDTELGSVG